VRIRLISDVPLGALLSGGVDSSIVVALMARASARPVQTFSIGFAHQEFNEAQYARAVAQRFGTDHHELVVEPNIQETLEILTRSLEEPFGDSSMIPTYHVTRMARQYVTVALSGDGGDELFAGYDRYLVNLGRQKFDSIPRWIGRGFREGVYPHVAPGVYGRRLLFSASLSSRDRYIDNVSHLPALDRERYLFSDDLLAWADKASPTQPFQKYFDDAPANDLLSRMMYLDTKTYLTADVLAKVDRMSMANSLEVRCPLLDHVFVEHAASLPASWKLRHGQRKYILKKLAERVGVPREVLYRPKQGFAMPLSHWWRNELKNDMLQILLEPRTLQRGYFNARSVRVLVDEHIRGRRDRSYEIWLLLILELWHRNFLEQVGNRDLGFSALAHNASSSQVNT
jgi:asparagine synthase (glutamine-hydrolysing)